MVMYLHMMDLSFADIHHPGRVPIRGLSDKLAGESRRRFYTRRSDSNFRISGRTLGAPPIHWNQGTTAKFEKMRA